MKLRSKLLLSATCLLTISVAATATSAYAWFISNRQAEVAINNANVKTNATNLKITGSIADGLGSASDGANNESTTISSSVTATDISGNGISFFKPRLSPKYDGSSNHMASKIEEVTADQKYYHEFKLTFTQTNTAVTTGVYLGSGSTVRSATKKDLPKAARIAFSTDNFTTVKLYLAPDGVSQSFYLKGTFDSEISLNAEKTNVVAPFTDISGKTAVTKYSDALPAVENDVNDATTSELKLASKFYLGNINSPTNSLDVTIRIWFEGMDTYCNKDNIATDMAANLKFYGVNMDI